MLHRILFLLPVLAVLLWSAIPGPALDFASERIQITLGRGFFHVEGHYFYHNRARVSRTQNLSVPLPVQTGSSALVEPLVRLVDDQGRSRALEVTNFLGRDYFRLYAGPGETCHVVVSFSHAAPENRGLYLLTTTAPWGKPLKRGEYIIRTVADSRADDAAKMRLLDSSLPLQARGPGLWSTELLDFMPDRDWTFSWSPDSSKDSPRGEML